MNEVVRKRYNILYTTSFGHMMGGGQWSLFYLIKHLNKDTFHPVVLCLEEGELAEKMRRVGADVILLKMGRMRHLNPFVVKRLISIIKKMHIALIHTDSSTETFYAGIAARTMGIPLLWHIRVSEREWFVNRVLSLLSIRLILVANTIAQRFEWLKNSNKIIVVHNSIDLEEFDNFPASSSIRKELNINKKAVLLGCIGRVEKRKGQEYLISAMRHVDSAKLLLVGRGEEEYVNRIQSLCEEFNISDRIIYTGYRNDIPSLLREIDILVFPTITEGLSRIILEAMAATKPVVVTEAGGNPEAVVDGVTGYIVPTKNAALLAARINELVENKDRRTTMGQAGRKRVEELFTIQQHVRSIQEVYRDVLEGK